MPHWSDAYVDLPYIPIEQDCAEVAAKVQREVFGNDVVVPSERRASVFGLSAQIAALKDDYGVRTETPQDGDAVLLLHCRRYHIGVYCVIDGVPHVLHALKSWGSTVRTRISRLATLGYTIEGYYKWKEHA